MREWSHQCQVYVSVCVCVPCLVVFAGCLAGKCLQGGSPMSEEFPEWQCLHAVTSTVDTRGVSGFNNWS